MTDGRKQQGPTASRDSSLCAVRMFTPFAAVAFVILGGHASVSIGNQAANDSARQVLMSVRAAAGGITLFQSIKSLFMSGSIQRVVVAGTSPGSLNSQALTISIRLPAWYLRQETKTLSSGKVTFVYGFHDDVLLNDVRTVGQDVHFGSSWGPEQLEVERAEFARLLFGCLTLETNAVPLQFTGVEHAAGPTGPAIVILVVGPRGFAAKLFVDKQTYRPVMLTYRATVRLPVPRTGGTSSRGSADIPSGPPPAQPQDVEMRFSDHRKVNGIYFPYRLIKSAAGVTLEDIVLRRVVINASITPEADPSHQ